jgi:hypothetical protein
MTAEFRRIMKDQPNKLFLSFIKPHKPVTPSTPVTPASQTSYSLKHARWIRSLLGQAGIDTEIFKAHSVRGAATSAAANGSVPLEEILKMADWNKRSTFQTILL